MKVTDRIPKSARHAAHELLLRRRVTAMAYAALRPKISGHLVKRDTDMVVEGWPRSGNTFSVACLVVAGDGRLKIASHSHSVSNVATGIRWGVPSVVVYRHPVDAVVSLMQRYPDLSATSALASYSRFHRAIYGLHKECLVLRFEEVTSSPNHIVQAVLDRWGIAVTPLTEEDLPSVLATVDELDMADTGATSITANTVARPSRARDSGKAELREIVLGKRRQLQGALGTYELLRGI